MNRALEQHPALPTSESQTLTYVVADGHRLVAQGIDSLLSSHHQHLRCIGCVDNSDELLELLDRTCPDLLLIGLYLDGKFSAFRVLYVCKERFPTMRLIVVSMYRSPYTIAKVSRLGANAFVLKDDGVEVLLDVVSKVIAGHRWLRPKTVDVTSDHKLTPREADILSLLIEGRTGSEMAAVLDVSVKTIEFYRKRLMERFDVSKATELVRAAIETGLFPATKRRTG